MKIYKTGALLSPPDPRDYSIQPLSAMQIPDTWTRTALPVIGEQLVNNCTAWGSGYAFEAKFGTQFSKGYVYGEREKSDWQGVGRFMHEVMHTMQNYGNVLLRDYNKELEVTKAQKDVALNSDTLRGLAKVYKIKAYARLYSEAEIKTALLSGCEVVAGIPVDKWEPDENGVWEGRDGRLGNHCIWVCDWSKDYPATFKCGNSWGRDWGKDGYFYASAEYLLFRNNVWAIEFNPKPHDEGDKKDIIRRTLRLRSSYMRGEDVREAQIMLTRHGFRLVADGIFGRRTHDAVRAFQTLHGLKVDGIIGKQTWAKLDIFPPAQPQSKIQQFIEWLLQQVGCIYVWGGQGETDITEEWIRKNETSAKNAERAIAFWKSQLAKGFTNLAAYDCSGLITKWLLDNKLIPFDRSSRGLYRDCIKLTRDVLMPGDLVFRHNGLRIFHVGVYIGEGLVVEAKGRNDGVVLRDIDASGSSYWNRFGRLEVLQ